jgi:quaternary ammonium compound-resistance protein SugE
VRKPGPYCLESKKEAAMAWIYLLLAGVFEIGFAIGLKYTAGFTRLWPSVGTIVAAAISLWLMTQALRTIPVGTAYAIWTGIGAVGVAVLGIVLFSDSASPARLGCITLIIAGVIGLKLVSAN